MSGEVPVWIDEQGEEYLPSKTLRLFSDDEDVPAELLLDAAEEAITKDKKLRLIESGKLDTYAEVGENPRESPYPLFAREHPRLAALMAVAFVGIAAFGFYHHLENSHHNIDHYPDTVPASDPEGIIPTDLSDLIGTADNHPGGFSIETAPLSTIDDEWQELDGLNGEGTTVVVVDTGAIPQDISVLPEHRADVIVDARRPEEKGAEVCEPNYGAEEIICGKDAFIHGVFTTATVEKIAPGVTTVNVAVLNESGDILPGWMKNAADFILGLAAQQLEQNNNTPIIVNMSFGIPNAEREDINPELVAAWERIAADPQIVMVGAAGNLGSSRCTWPWNEESGVWRPHIDVGAVNVSPDQQLELRGTSSWGCPDVVDAGGGDVGIFDAGGDFHLTRGTSFAAPRIAAKLAMIKQRYEELGINANRDDLRKAILASARPLQPDEFDLEGLLRNNHVTNRFKPQELLNSPSILFGYGMPTPEQMETVLDAIERGIPILPLRILLRPDAEVIIADKNALSPSQTIPVALRLFSFGGWKSLNLFAETRNNSEANLYLPKTAGYFMLDSPKNTNEPPLLIFPQTTIPFPSY